MHVGGNASREGSNLDSSSSSAVYPAGGQSSLGMSVGNGFPSVNKFRGESSVGCRQPSPSPLAGEALTLAISQRERKQESWRERTRQPQGCWTYFSSPRVWGLGVRWVFSALRRWRVRLAGLDVNPFAPAGSVEGTPRPKRCPQGSAATSGGDMRGWR